MTKPLLAILLLASYGAVAAPQDPFNKPVSISWWHSSCKDAYITNPERGYSKGYCDGVMLAYMNELEQWCVPDDVSWGEVQDYVGSAIAEATIKPLSQIDIGDWISNALVVKWPCEIVNTSGLVTDPELIEKSNAQREEQKAQLTQKKLQTQASVHASKEERSEEIIVVHEPPSPTVESALESPKNVAIEVDGQLVDSVKHSEKLLSDEALADWMNPKLGITEEELDQIERRDRARDGIGILGAKVPKRCEQRGLYRWCTYPEALGYGDRRLQMSVQFFGGESIGVAFQGSRSRVKYHLERYARRMAEDLQPTISGEEAMQWHSDSLLFSVDWGQGSIMYLDTVKYAQSQN